MKKGMWAMTAVLGLALGALSAAPASAAPLGADVGGMKAAATEASPVEKARWVVRCWHDWRGRHCRRVWIGPSYGWVPPHYYRGGHRHWRGDHRHGFRPSFRGGGGGPRMDGGMGGGRPR